LKVGKTKQLKVGDRLKITHDFLPKEGILGTVKENSDSLFIERDNDERTA